MVKSTPEYFKNVLQITHNYGSNTTIIQIFVRFAHRNAAYSHEKIAFISGNNKNLDADRHKKINKIDSEKN